MGEQCLGRKLINNTKVPFQGLKNLMPQHFKMELWGTFLLEFTQSYRHFAQAQVEASLGGKLET